MSESVRSLDALNQAHSEVAAAIATAWL